MFCYKVKCKLNEMRSNLYHNWRKKKPTLGASIQAIHMDLLKIKMFGKHVKENINIKFVNGRYKRRSNYTGNRVY